MNADTSTADAIRASLLSDDTDNSNGNPLNIADALDNLQRAVHGVGDAITPSGASAGHDAYGGAVTSLTEAIMGVTGGLCRIAESLQAIADALEKR